MKQILVALILVFGVMGDTQAADPITVGELVISDVWARATPPNVKTGAVYITITNHGNSMEMIKSISTEIAGKAMVHQSIEVDGIMKMEHMMHVMIKPGTTLIMKPGGFHVMLMKLKEPLTDGESFPMTITFDKAGDVNLEIEIKK